MRSIDREMQHRGPMEIDGNPTPPPTYADMVRQSIPRWLKHTSKGTVYQPMKRLISEDEQRQRAREKYGRGFRKKPPARNRVVWQHFVDRNRSLASDGYWWCTGAVHRVLKVRELAWEKHPQGMLQRQKLSGLAGLSQKGVIYALVNEHAYFGVRTPIYIGQTSQDVMARVQRHVDKAFAEKTKGMEMKIVEALRNTDRWWQKWVVIPLEVIPEPGGHTPGTQAYLDAFRAMATPREQAWIRELNTGYPCGFNLEVHEGNPLTRERREKRRQSHVQNEWQKVPKKGRSDAQGDNALPEPPWWLDGSGLHFSRCPGPERRVRKMLADYVRLDSEKERKDLLAKQPRWHKDQIMSWLTKNKPHERTASKLFEQIILAVHQSQKASSHTSQRIFRSYDATAPEEQEKRNKKKKKAAECFWIKVPWRRDEMQTLALHSLLNAKEIEALYPIAGEHGKVKVSYNLAVPIGVMLQNYDKVAKEVDFIDEAPPEVPEPQFCACQHFKTPGAINFHSHVASTDPGFIKNDRLRSYWLKGRKFRVQAHPQVLMENFQKSLDKFISTAARRNKMEEASFHAWRQKLLEVLQAKCDTMFAEENAPYHTFLSKDGFRELQNLHQHMVITYADKSSHDFVCCCKHVYKRLLWEEMRSEHYKGEAKCNEEIWNGHDKLSELVGKGPVHAHRYLYGILKMHKNPVGVRWIAGNHMQDMGDHGKKFPGCSLSPAEMTLGGILRMCMHNLLYKDRSCRKKGYKRYWVVTNVDTVAADIKHNVNSLRGQSVFTRDFTRMYTSIPQSELVSAVQQAIQEAFEWHSQKKSIPMENLKVKVTYPRAGHAFACFDKSGFTMAEVLQLLTAVCSEVYFQQRENGSIAKQSNGLPMGGKASAELANLYCYVKESGFIDSLIADGKLDEAKRWFHTWRYIDDLCGFGDRGDMWQKIPYGMEHVETTELRHSTPKGTSEAVFLGMRIKSNPDGIWTSIQPKGDGWAWLPRKFIDYSSCHTHFTKWYMFKGLLIRALTICNNQADFMKAVIHYAQGLVSRGFPSKTLWRAWRKFSYEKVPHAVARQKLTEDFRVWLEKQSFKHAHPDEEVLREGRKQTTKGCFQRSLMCGFHAVNHILHALGHSALFECELDQVAQEMADREESLLYSNEPHAVMDLAADPRGNYAADTLIQLLQCRTNLKVERWRSGQPFSSCAMLVGSGNHWQAVLLDKDKHWFVLEQGSKMPLQDVLRFLQSRLANGAVYEVGMFEQLPNVRYLDNLSQERMTGQAVCSSDARNHQHSESPPCKRPYTREVFCIQSPPKPAPKPACQISSTLPGVILPDDFQADPLFHFEGPKMSLDLEEIAPASGIDDLLQAMTPAEDENSDTPRAHRRRSKPQLYQSEVEETRERNLKKGQF